MSQAPFFTTPLKLSLKLESDGKEAEVFSGDIERVSLNLQSYGHQGHIWFNALNNDDVYQMFVSPKKMTVTMTFLSPNPLESDPWLELKGIVTNKSFRRFSARDGEEDDKSDRLYEIAFADAAKVTWNEHHPINIYVDASMKDIIEKHINPDIDLKFEWDPLEKKHPVTAFALPHKGNQGVREHTSFYSFLHWYLHKENGILLYDYKENNYKISGKKEPPSGEPQAVFESQVTAPVCIFPQTLRYNEKTLKHLATSLEAEDKENPESFKSVRREQMDASAYRVYPNQVDEQGNPVLTTAEPEVSVEFVEFFKTLTLAKLTPGSFVTFKADLKANWTLDDCFKDKKFRVRNLYLEANLMANNDVIENPLVPFQLYIKGELEAEAETFVTRPHFIPPTYPFYINGTIFSDIGDKEQSTFKILETEEAPQGQYQVLVPLEGEGKKVVAPFEPDDSGQDYAPFRKDTKVEVALYFRTAKITRAVDWNSLVRLPMGVQGNQTVLGSNGKDIYTLIRHEFDKVKDPVFTILQSSSETQKQTVQIKEKEILISMVEKDKKTVSIQFSHEKGLILTLEDKDAGMTQTTVFDGKSMTHTCKGNEGTSTITQKPDGIAVECKKFSITADEIILEGKDKISMKGANKVGVESSVVDVASPSVKLGG